jgi:hypothetical protein
VTFTVVVCPIVRVVLPLVPNVAEPEPELEIESATVVCFRMGMSGSASFQKVRNRLLGLWRGQLSAPD